VSRFARSFGTYFDCASGNVAIVGQPGGKRGPVVESEGWLVLGEFQLLVERVNFFPESEHLFLFLREVGSLRDYTRSQRL